MKATHPPVRSFHQLTTWRKAFALARACYGLARQLPADERYGLGSQLRRAAASVPANIAEGNGRHARGDYLRFLHYAHGSLMELQTHLMLAAALGYVPRTDAVRVIQQSREVGRMLGSMIRRLSAGGRASRVPNTPK